MKSTESAPLSPGESQQKCTDQAHQTTPSGKKHTSRSFEQEASHPFDEEMSEPPKKQVEELCGDHYVSKTVRRVEEHILHVLTFQRIIMEICISFYFGDIIAA